MGRLLALLAVTGTVGLVATPGCAAGGHSKPKTATEQTEARAVPTPAISRPRGRVVTVTPPPQPSGTRWVDVVVDWLREGRSPTVFIHTPDNADAPMLARRFHEEIRARLPQLDPLPRPVPVEPLTLF